jgi:UDP-N-acetylmuramate dehydrogenase
MHIEEHVILAEHTWFGTGGAARFFCEPRQDEEMQAALAFARQHALAVCVLGDGANVLISDAGIDGLVIKPAAREVIILPDTNEPAHVLVQAGAGATIDAVIETCLAQHVVGLEDFSGIPGTIGGALFINVHYFERFIGERLRWARVVERATGKIQKVDAAWFAFGYDTSALHAHEHIVLDATFRLDRVDAVGTAYARGRRAEIVRHRERRYPTEGTCGSFFRNFLPEEVPFSVQGRKILSVAYYLDKLGVKGELAVGGAAVSHKHANMLVNTGTATSQDIAHLARTLQEKMKAQFGLVPQPECQLLGFAANPLLA